jgi:hypothetical protein
LSLWDRDGVRWVDHKRVVYIKSKGNHLTFPILNTWLRNEAF